MPQPDNAPWTLMFLLETLDSWIAAEQPNAWLALRVSDWAERLTAGPKGSGLREQGEATNLWFGVVPGTSDGWQAVTCACWCLNADRTIRFDRFATLEHPIPDLWLPSDNITDEDE